MLDLQQTQEHRTAPPSREATDAEGRVQTTKPVLLRREIAEAARAVEIAKAQEQQVGTRRKNTGGQPQKYFLSEEGRALILARYDSQTATITWLAEQLSTAEQSIPRWQVRKWAKDLGIARIKEPPWSEAEVSYLRNSVRRYGLGKIAKALGRTETSVKIKAKRLGIRKLVTGDGYTMRAVCRGLSVDHHQVERWLTNEWFWGERRESHRHGRQRGDIWYFTPEAIRALVRQHPEEIDLRRVDRDFFIEVLLGPPQVDARSAPALPRQAARSVYAYMSDEAHALIIAHYTGGLRRTEALAEVLGVTSDEITTWAVLLGLEDASLHQPHVHQQKGRKAAHSGTGRAADSSISQSVRHLLETRFNGDPEATEALADDLGCSVEEVCALAQAVGISGEWPSDDEKSTSAARGRRATRRAASASGGRGTEIPPEDIIPLPAQLLIAMHYQDTKTSLEQLAEELTRMLAAASEAPISVGQVNAWAKRLGLRSRRSRTSAPGLRVRSERGDKKEVRLAPLQLDAGEWNRFLSPAELQTLSLARASSDLPTVEEIHLGYLVHLGRQERSRATDEQDQSVLEAAHQAQVRLTTALHHLVVTQALSMLGQGISLHALLHAGRRGLERAVCSFDYTETQPLFTVALPAIKEEMQQMAAHAPASIPASRRTKAARLFARIALTSETLAGESGRAPTVQIIAEALALPLKQVEETIACIVQAGPTGRSAMEASTAQRGRKPKVSEEQFLEAFRNTRCQVSSAIIKELAEVLPLAPLTIQVKFYRLRLHTRLAERECARISYDGTDAASVSESDRPSRIALQQGPSVLPDAEARHARGGDLQACAKLRVKDRQEDWPALLERGHNLWDVVVDGQKRRWALAMPYGELADTLSPSTSVVFEQRLYCAERVYHSMLVVRTVEAGNAPQEEPG